MHEIGAMGLALPAQLPLGPMAQLPTHWSFQKVIPNVIPPSHLISMLALYYIGEKYTHFEERLT